MPMDRYASLFYGFRMGKIPENIRAYLDKLQISIMDYFETKLPNEQVGVHFWENPRTGDYEDFIILNISYLRTPSIRENAGIRILDALPVKDPSWDSILKKFCDNFGFIFSEPKWYLLADIE